MPGAASSDTTALQVARRMTDATRRCRQFSSDSSVRSAPEKKGPSVKLLEHLSCSAVLWMKAQYRNALSRLLCRGGRRGRLHNCRAGFCHHSCLMEKDAVEALPSKSVNQACAQKALTQIKGCTPQGRHGRIPHLGSSQDRTSGSFLLSECACLVRAAYRRVPEFTATWISYAKRENTSNSGFYTCTKNVPNCRFCS